MLLLELLGSMLLLEPSLDEMLLLEPSLDDLMLLLELLGSMGTGLCWCWCSSSSGPRFSVIAIVCCSLVDL